MSENSLNFVEKYGRIVFNIKVVPGSSKTLIAGLYNGMIKVRLSAAPEKGKANQALIELLAENFNIPKNSITILSGLTSKIKQVSIAGSTQVRDVILSIGK
ncbi:MAG: hypothetical protein A2Y12_18675 [Planctomycetes bacterium GWF2_42_9]|nr:MAG: hypothetical protein A2Y12_18675 [Planctomycetes bacterium GWF2_42_9]HAL45238.1 hypothetical protein [Phycisphaerales bacterium]